MMRVRDVPFFDQPLLAIETSCDETSAAVLVGREIRSNIVASQASRHAEWGGVVPEVASRMHVEAILPTVRTALSQASVQLSDLGAIVVTNRPGLVGALSVGVSAAKAFSQAIAVRVPGFKFLGVHHLEGHLASPFAEHGDLPFPHLALIVSGGHTELVAVNAPGEYTLLGQTIDDAAGEAFDKGARLLGLGYPGGSAIEQAAESGDAQRYKLPQGLRGDTLDFSFSGLKTAVLRLTQTESRLHVPSAAASLQAAIVNALTAKTMLALEEHGFAALTLVGGVAANRSLRARLSEECARRSVMFAVPEFSLCTDNAGMIGLAGSWRLARGEKSDWNLDAAPTADLL